MNACPRLGRWRGCKFRPRYDQTVSEHAAQICAIAAAAGQTVSVPMDSAYVRDVCIRCGKAVQRS